MRFALPIAGLILAGSLAGCEKSPEVIPGAKHGGSMAQLLDGKGYVEVVVDAPAGSGGRRGKAEPRVAVAYFYGRDGATPMSPPPTDVTFKIGRADALPLAPREADGAFASKPGDFPDGFRAVVAAKRDGDPIEATVAVR